MYINILGRGIRANIHKQPEQPLDPILAVIDHADAAPRYALGAIAGPAVACYAAMPQHRRCGSEVWIETSSVVDLATTPLPPPQSGGFHVHTNTNHAKTNAKRLRENPTCMAFKPVLALRTSKSGKAALCMRATTTGPSWLIYAAPGSNIAPMPCGAFVWLLTFHAVTFEPVDQESAPTA